ncbi:MAG: hypothetical protein JJU18_12280 [Oceanicaulis sp.]|nr:hypothetical protein [Oceanicaulis sp.]
MIRLTAAMLAAVLLAAPAAALPPDAAQGQSGTWPDIQRTDISLEARPDQASAGRWARERRTLVISLLTAPETESLGFDYPVDVMSEGMTYANVPVSQMTGPEAADALAAILADADGPVVIHCGTSVRAAHLYAASLIRSGALTRGELHRIDPGRDWNPALLDRLTGETPDRESAQD